MLVAIEDLQDYMDIKFSNRQRRAAEHVLTGLQSELETLLNRPIEIGTYTESHILDTSHDIIRAGTFVFYDTSLDTTGVPMSVVAPPITVYLRNSPVISCTSVTVTASSASATPLFVDENTDYVVRRYGIDLYRGFVNDTVTVTYTAGLDGENISFFKLLILRAATREMQNMHDDVVGIKDLNTRNVAPLETGFTDKEIRSVKKYRRIRI
jgi:hypothetical protein